MDKTIQKTIYKNLFGKTELKSNRVELASIQMVEAMVRDAEDLYKQSQDFLQEKEDYEKRKRVLNQEAVAMSNGLNQELQELKSQADALGLEVANLEIYQKGLNLVEIMETTAFLTE